MMKCVAEDLVECSELRRRPFIFIGNSYTPPALYGLHHRRFSQLLLQATPASFCQKRCCEQKVTLCHCSATIVFIFAAQCKDGGMCAADVLKLKQLMNE